MVKFWVVFALAVAAVATLSYWGSAESGDPLRFSFSLGSGSGVQGSGVSRTESRAVGDFQRIHAEGAGTLEVDVSPGAGRSVEVTTDDNLLGLIRTEVTGGVLEVSSTGNLSSRSNLRLKVVVPELAGIHLEGANKLRLNIDSSRDFDLHIEGAGRARAEGHVGALTVHSEGAGDVDAAELVARAVDVHIEGAGKARVHATEKLRARIEGTGLVTYRGTPASVEKTIDGIGRIRQAD